MDGVRRVVHYAKFSIRKLQRSCTMYPQLGRAHTMTNADNGAWHAFFKVIDHPQEVTGMVKPIRWSGIMILDNTLSY